MQEEDVRNGNRRKTLARTSRKAHDNTRNQKVGVLFRDAAPHGRDEIHAKGHNVDGAAAVLVDQGHPDEVAQALEQRGAVEEVGRLGDGAGHARLLPVGEEVLGRLEDGEGRAGGEEVAEDHGEADGDGRVELEGSGPVWLGSVSW